MAHPTRGRDPLLDASTQAFLERRAQEAFGLLLFFVGLFLSIVISSYSAEDAAWVATGTPELSNIAGPFGVAISTPLIKIMGYGGWGLPIVFLAWGARLMVHRGSERMLTRMIYAPIFWAFISIYAATLTPVSGWLHSFSMGGLFGDTVLFMILQILPGSAALGANAVALVLGILVMILGFYVAGVTLSETKLIFRGMNLALSALVVIIGAKLRARSDFKAESSKDYVEKRQVQPGFYSMTVEPNITSAKETARVAFVIRENSAMPVSFGNDVPPPAPKSLFARVPALLKRNGALETISPPNNNGDSTNKSIEENRIRGKIADAIRARAPQPTLTANGKLPIVTEKQGRPMSPRPIVLEPETFNSIDEKDNSFDSEDGTTRFDHVTRSHFSETSVIAPVKQVVQHPLKRAIQQSSQAKAELQPKLQFEPTAGEQNFEMPPLSLLMNPELIERHVLSDDALESNARMLESVLDDYGVKGEIVSVRPGPVVTMYELEPAPGLKASRVIGLADDIARSMSALSARVSTLPGRSVIGIELPNENREMCALREILSARDFGDANMQLPLALGKDIGGEPIVANLAKMPHLLIAGTTGSGKSVAINTMILSLLYRLSPEECRMIMIDPKMLELSVYDGIPHLLSPVVTDPKKAVVALKWTVGEMEDRYRKMSKMGVRNIDGYNSRVKDAMSKDELFNRTVQTGFDDVTGEPLFETEEFAPETLPYIVVIVDEMADLMMVAGKEIEACIQRLAQMARASGIHIIMATQRPSVDVITGTIKANFPTRISFQVTSKVDSRTILGEMGAEQLLGMGDMLYMAGGGKITRVHGPFCSDEEVEEVVNHLKKFGPPDYLSGVVEGPSDDKESSIDAVLGLGGNSDTEDALYDTAVQIVIKDRKCSTSYIQRKLAIGYNKAARLVEQMEDNGLVSSANHVGKREILVPERG
jgi:DNA segregation ATPase FtsK/SpoIIIE, S-DNA-T family